MDEQTTNGGLAPPSDERLRRAFDDGYAAAASGEEAAPGCTTTAEGRAFLRGYVAGAKARGLASAADER
jgi:ribosome modulation factor